MYVQRPPTQEEGYTGIPRTSDKVYYTKGSYRDLYTYSYFQNDIV